MRWVRGIWESVAEERGLAAVTLVLTLTLAAFFYLLAEIGGIEVSVRHEAHVSVSRDQSLGAAIERGLDEAAAERRAINAKIDHGQRETRELLLRIALPDQTARVDTRRCSARRRSR